MYEDRVTKSIFDGTGLKPKGAQSFNVKPTADTPNILKNAEGSPGNTMSITDMTGPTGGILQGLSTFNTLNEMDTSAESGGVMSKDNAMLSGAAGGASAGAAIGSVIPGVGTVIGGAVGAIGGGIVGAIKQSAAEKEYLANVQNKNLSESAEERIKREKQYHMEKGLADIQNLKALREKSLGIIS